LDDKNMSTPVRKKGKEGGRKKRRKEEKKLKYSGLLVAHA
jgi:hypothetical protein